VWQSTAGTERAPVGRQMSATPSELNWTALQIGGASALGALTGSSWATLVGRPIIVTGLRVGVHTSVISSVFFGTRAFFNGDRCSFPAVQSSALAGATTGFLAAATRGGSKVAPAYITVFGAFGLGYHFLAGQTEVMLRQLSVERAAQRSAEALQALHKQAEEAAGIQHPTGPAPATFRAATQEEEDHIDRKWYEVVRKW